MKIAFLYGWLSCPNRFFNFENLYDAPQGLTGSEVSCFTFAREMAKRGHEVSLYTVISSPNYYKWHGVTVRPIDELRFEGNAHDIYYSWNDPGDLVYVDSSKLRVLNQQLNDFDYCTPGFVNNVDVLTSPSRVHRDFLISLIGAKEKWEVMPNGCDPAQYTPGVKVPGRILYASSPDRGLHWLLQEWPKIRRRVPHAELRVFYNFQSWYDNLQNIPHDAGPHLRETAMRASYIRMALDKLAPHGVTHLHSVSRNQMAKEFSEAQVLSYPCDPIRWTEGFSVTTLEACASRTLPVICGADALQDIYGGCAITSATPIRAHLPEFVDNVVKGVTDDKFRTDVTDRCLAFANQYRWDVLADRMERLLLAKLAAKGAAR